MELAQTNGPSILISHLQEGPHSYSVQSIDSTRDYPSNSESRTETRWILRSRPWGLESEHIDSRPSQNIGALFAFSPTTVNSASKPGSCYLRNLQLAVQTFTDVPANLTEMKMHTTLVEFLPAPKRESSLSHTIPDEKNAATASSGTNRTHCAVHLDISL
ncbi:hypothetical protein CIRG_06936 [Coccidioides immitis RMSCC 2394]|uniref:Uncharacterized protein n=1 Tax=Coccidioides immitis RMSCC 2394 TaxID=404692 RepID=A0A0J6YI06_COCIT|nr:hypothetical protein CIRG_06936 [Coccidioides immitis RMSCC 2394]